MSVLKIDAKTYSGEGAILRVMPWVLFLQFLQLFNESVFTLVTPNIALGFHISPSSASLIVAVAGISFGIGGGVYAVMADIISMKKLFIFGVLLFCAASMLGFIFQDFYYAVVVCRFVQTLGSGIIPGCLIVLVARYVPGKHKARYFGYTSAMFQLSSGIGYFIGGFIATYISWQYGFMVPLLSLICIPFFMKYLPDEELKNSKLDILGALLLCTLIIFLILAVTFLSVLLCIIGIIFLILFIVFSIKKERGGKIPFIRLSLLKNYKFVFGILVAFLIFGIQNALYFVFPFILHDIYHAESVLIGEMYIPGTICAFIVGIFAGKIVNSFGAMKSVYIGVTCVILSMLIFAFFIGSPIWYMVIALTIFSCGFPLFFVGYIGLFTSSLPSENVGTCMGVWNITVNIYTGILPTVIGMIITYNILGFKFISLDKLSLISSNFSNIMLLFVISLVIGLIVFTFVFRKKTGLQN